MNHSQALATAINALTLISAPRRPDGTYNRDRAACELLARETLRKLDQFAGLAPDVEGDEPSPVVVRTHAPAPKPAASIPSSGLVQPAGSDKPLEALTKQPRQLSGPGPFIVYSDGASKGNPGRSSWGIVVVHDGSVVLSEGGFLGVHTNQVAELMAALEALRRTPVGATVELVSDSQYTLNGLTTWRKSWAKNGWMTANRQPVANKDIWVALAAEADMRNVTTRWVRGHNGDEMNELADDLANEAVARGGPVTRM